MLFRFGWSFALFLDKAKDRQGKSVVLTSGNMCHVVAVEVHSLIKRENISMLVKTHSQIDTKNKKST